MRLLYLTREMDEGGRSAVPPTVSTQHAAERSAPALPFEALYIC